MILVGDPASSSTITALMGMTMIIGISTEMAIFYVSEYTELRASHAGPRRLARSSKNRLRPITMTTLAAISPCCLWRSRSDRAPASSSRWPCRSFAGLLLQFPTVLLAMPVLISFTVRHDHVTTTPATAVPANPAAPRSENANGEWRIVSGEGQTPPVPFPTSLLRHSPTKRSAKWQATCRPSSDRTAGRSSRHTLDGMRAAGREHTALRGSSGERQLAFGQALRRPPIRQARRRGEQRLRVGMQRPGEDQLLWPLLHREAEIHDHDVMGDVPDPPPDRAR